MPEPITSAALTRVLRALAARGASDALLIETAAGLSVYGRTYGVLDTPLRLSHLLGQLAHESGGFRFVEELWGPTAAQRRYEGRGDLGNTRPGDGYRFRGRGLIQTTGRANYRALTQGLRARGYDCPDFEAEPGAVAQTPWALLSALEFWRRVGLNRTADGGDTEADVRRVTLRVNGGTNGLADRVALFRTAARLVREAAGMAPDAPLTAWPEPEPPAGGGAAGGGAFGPLGGRPPQPLPTKPVPDVNDAVGVSKLPPGTRKAQPRAEK